MLTKITFTGADNSVNPEELIEFSQQYPFVEWGILFGNSWYMKQTRFPTPEWLENLWVLYQKSDKTAQFSAHLCGDLVVQAFLGQGNRRLYHILTMPLFNRVQFNTHGERHHYSEKMIELLSFSDFFKETIRSHSEQEYRASKTTDPKTQYIFQLDGENAEALAFAKHKDVNVAALFDKSHGSGRLPSTWHESLQSSIHCGYAGGLSPENILEELPKIKAAAAGNQYWIDMETHVRSDDFTKFDMKKVESVVTQILKAQYIEPKQESASTSPQVQS